MLKKFFKDQSGQVLMTDLIILIPIMAIIGITVSAILTPSIETGFADAEESIKELKGGGF